MVLLAAGLLEEAAGARPVTVSTSITTATPLRSGSWPRSPSMIAAHTSSLISGATRARPSIERNIGPGPSGPP